MDSYHRHRAVNFGIMFLSYGVLFLCRKSFSYLLPSIIKEENFTKSQLGAISSSLMLAYCISKFICGILSDRLKPNRFLTVGLITVGLLNIQFSYTYSVTLFAVIWFLNGLGQGAGWPPCTKLMKQWYHPSELGTWWSILSASSNLSGSLGPLVMSAATYYLGWRYVMAIAGSLCMATSSLTFLFVTNSPKDVGLSPLGRDRLSAATKEQSEPETKLGGVHQQNGVKNGHIPNGNGDDGTKTCDVNTNGGTKNGVKRRGSDGTSPNGTMAKERNGVDKTSPQTDEDSDSTIGDVLRSPFLWIISVIFCLVTLQSGAFQEWAQLLLIQDRGFSAAMGSGFTSAYNTGGFLGCISSGLITDRLVANSAKRKVGSPRLDYMIAASICSLLCQLSFLRLTTPDSARGVIVFCAFTIGFCIYSCVSLLGVLIIENSPIHMSGTAHAIGALAGNVGAVSSGLPLSYISSLYDWSVTFTIVMVLAAISTLLMFLCNRIDMSIGRNAKIKTG